ncbi:MAG: hypothetical protein WCI17_08085 [bacterium]
MPVCGFRPSGVLRERTHLNFDRMDSARFAAVRKTGCLQGPNYAWPGDMEGRSLLAFVLLDRATGCASANLAGLRAVWAGELNSHGYFGRPLDPQAINEQQLASHGWVLRGLCELYAWRKDPVVMDEIRVMVKNLALPTRGAHAVYPIDPAERRKGVGNFVGEHAQRVGRWLLSSDVGCDLIFMDGLMHAATLLNDPEVDALCEEILARNLQIDLLAIQAQTHATLTGVRGILRWAAHKQRPSLVAEAEARFRLYVDEGITENYENWNWFGRPTHTEPCAVVDSLMVAHELWRLTGKADYLAWAHRITHSGFFAEQVSNGGFGCSTVTGADGARRLGFSEAGFEAWWCCSMRAAEGLSDLARRALHTDGADLYVTGLWPGRVDLPLAGGRLIGTASGGYPCEGRWVLSIEAAPVAAPVTIHLFAPPWGASPVVQLNGQPVSAAQNAVEGFVNVTLQLAAGDRLAYAFEQSIHTQPTRNRHSLPGHVTYNYGPLVLALPSGAPEVRSLPPPQAWRWNETAGCATAAGFDGALSPLGERHRRADPNPAAYGRQLLFEGRAG